MTNWTLNPTLAFDRPGTSPDTLDLIRLNEVQIFLVQSSAHTETLSMRVRLEYGLMENGFKGYRRVDHDLNQASTQAILTTPITSGNIASNMEAAIWDELERLGLIEPGSR